MPAFLYQRIHKNEVEILHQVRKVPMAGRYLIQSHWELKGRPINQGWHISEMEMVEYAVGEIANPGAYSIIIEGTPSVKTKVYQYELFDIYVYTHGYIETQQNVTISQWSNLMLKVKKVFQIPYW